MMGGGVKEPVDPAQECTSPPRIIGISSGLGICILNQLLRPEMQSAVRDLIAWG